MEIYVYISIHFYTNLSSMYIILFYIELNPF